MFKGQEAKMRLKLVLHAKEHRWPLTEIEDRKTGMLYPLSILLLLFSLFPHVQLLKEQGFV